MYELVRDDGTVDPLKVLKAKHKYALLTKMQREWEVGRRISNLSDPGRALPGFMSVGPAVCSEKGNFKGKGFPCYIPPCCRQSTYAAAMNTVKCSRCCA